MIQDVFGFPVSLSEPFDFGFLTRYGKAFGIYGDQMSGNICFGMQSPEWGKLFVKFAGAPLHNARVTPAEAAFTLRTAMPIYKDLFAHPSLVRLLGCGNIGGGFLAVYRFEEGEPLWPQDAILSCSVASRLYMMESMLDFHLFALDKGYIASGMDPENFIIDPNEPRLHICDIDLYRHIPAVNTKGRMPGSSRMLSSEEYETGAVLDDITTQYNLGALAFAMFSPGYSREEKDWQGPEPLYSVAACACNEDRSQRYSSLRAFATAWRQMLNLIRI